MAISYLQRRTVGLEHVMHVWQGFVAKNTEWSLVTHPGAINVG